MNMKLNFIKILRFGLKFKKYQSLINVVIDHTNVDDSIEAVTVQTAVLYEFTK